MAAKLNVTAEKVESVVRELDVTLIDKNGDERAVVAELLADGKVSLRLKGMKRSVSVDLVAALGGARDGEETPVVEADQPKTAKKRTELEHLQGI
jgi:hypothetical protein